MKKLSFLFLAFGLFFSSCDTLQQVAKEVLSEPSLDEIGRGLKEALTNGISKGAESLAKKGGYLDGPYKILLPSNVRQVTDRLKVLPGFSNIEAELIEKINRGAEDAATEAKPIFVSAIKSMTIQDATNILMGTDNAATSYLQRTTSTQLYEKFNPKIVNSLEKVGANTLWKRAADTYNKIPMVNKINNDLDDYVTNEALKGLFSKVGEEEKNIRRNKTSRTSELLRKVFAKQDSNRK
ncbi:MAG: DUF4197 domain-containing protein [Saprospiraceae bacterium]|nr:DUF4197 domain-containing protein [Saprospiraceae bacterium]